MNGVVQFYVADAETMYVFIVQSEMLCFPDDSKRSGALGYVECEMLGVRGRKCVCMNVQYACGCLCVGECLDGFVL